MIEKYITPQPQKIKENTLKNMFLFMLLFFLTSPVIAEEEMLFNN